MFLAYDSGQVELLKVCRGECWKVDKLEDKELISSYSRYTLVCLQPFQGGNFPRKNDLLPLLWGIEVNCEAEGVDSIAVPVDCRQII